MFKSIFGAGVAACLALGAHAAPYSWVQLLPDGKASLRVISPQPCDHVASSIPLTLRGPDTLVDMKDAQGVSLRVCSADFDRAAHATVTVGARVMAVPQTAPLRVAVIGDTGCRKEGHARDQKCHAPDWIFDAVADAVAETQPDLTVHVGDFVYQYNCYDGVEGCGNDHQLRNWQFWDADFFTKADDLLTASPWVFVRGNHEDCEKTDRGWRGWSLFFAVGDVDDTFSGCTVAQEGDKAHLIGLPGGAGVSALDLVLYDSADEPKYLTKSDFAVAEGKAEEVWLLTHVPLWSAYDTYRGSLPDTIDMVLSGHEHLFELVQYAVGDPVQVVQGASGTKLEQPHRTPAYHFDERNAQDFSFLMITRLGGSEQVMTLCAVPPSGGAVARNTWHVDAARVITGIDARQVDCDAPS